MKKEKLLIIDKHQFGYLTDVYKWCEGLRKFYDITVISADLGKPQIRLDGIKVRYVPFNMPKSLRGRLFVLISVLYILLTSGPIIIEYFPRCSIFPKLFPNKKIILDIRTLSVSPDNVHREKYNSGVIKECEFFKNISVISKGIAEEIKHKNCHILPLGSDIISTVEKDYIKNIRLLYIGTLRWRRIEDTLHGIKLFKNSHPDINIEYDIVGDGDDGELDKLKELAINLNISDIITFHGWVAFDKIKPFFDKSNVGICYVPITKYYDNQPPTKTFEYVNSGLYCIATQTKSNHELITDINGCLIEDTPEGVCCGLEQFIKSSSDLNEDKIRMSLSEYSWGSIIKNNLTTYIESLL